ncbi:adenylate/guanylate cyclase domain-containing protein [Gordonia spumicola]|uniref:Adenylate/guanylate cyclase domain-containing protein n=1 Tax=Gordonia spumicola TaxID=589161 RepID=A0A7I9VDE3_9ACTN|nr:adenylate/guanylate cyclase domain-containing protein [Gordonia spumicola]GEE03030.1 adenylate/guanylate cyclase domain-containing protein [Gordonia spumicola]
MDTNHDVDLHDLASKVETFLLGGERTFSARDLAEHVGIDLEYGRAMWRAMGFPIEDDDAIVLTRRDATATKGAMHAVDLGMVTADEVLSFTRLTGQVFAQLAESEGEALMRIVLDGVARVGSDETLERLMGDALPLIEALHVYVWRRQLAAFITRTVAQYDRTGTTSADVTVGFADISGFTAHSRTVSPADLADLLELFESIATDAVGAHDGRVVKLIGDAVLFTAPTAASGVSIARDLLDAWPVDRPPVRAGIASGPVLRRLGDVFGLTVNIASRLTSLGGPGQIRIDEATRAGLPPDASYRVVEQSPQNVRGYDSLHSWTVEEDVS